MRKGICSYNRQQGRREGDGPPLEGGVGAVRQPPVHGLVGIFDVSEIFLLVTACTLPWSKIT
jgi:hypothetical protein